MGEFDLLSSNSTNSTDLAYGLAANALAVLLYGSCTVPVKRVEAGDGMFFQWVSCATIWMAAKVGDMILNSPKCHPLALLGGALWATGNITVVPVVKTIGLSLGILIWGSSSLLIGWASSRFGWFGITPQEVSRPTLNCCGAALCLLSGLIFFCVKSDVEPHSGSETHPLLRDRGSNSGGYAANPSAFWIDKVGPRTRRLVGFLLAVAAGLLYGLSFVPVLYIKSHSLFHGSVYYGASLSDVDYVYIHCSGIFLTTSLYFFIYCAVMSNRPRIYSRAILPAFASGLMWTVGSYSWFLANNHLSAVVTFPIVTAGYGLVAALWGSLVFREIRGLGNCLVFLLASCVVLTGSVLTAVSKL